MGHSQADQRGSRFEAPRFHLLDEVVGERQLLEPLERRECVHGHPPQPVALQVTAKEGILVLVIYRRSWGNDVIRGSAVWKLAGSFT